MSSVRYSSGQNTLLEHSLFVVSGVEIEGLDLKMEARSFRLVGVLVPASLLGAHLSSSQEDLGCPLRPCTKMMLCYVRYAI